MALPTYVAAGASDNNIAALSLPLPTGWAAGDIHLLLVETANEAVTTPTGYTELGVQANRGSGTAAGTDATRLAVYWRRAVAGDTDPVAVADAGNHAVGIIAGFRGCITTGNPWDVFADSVEATSDTSVSITGVTTTVADCLVIYAFTSGFDAGTDQMSGAPSNASLANLTQRFDANGAAGNGGTIVLVTGEKATAGATGTLTATLLNASRKGQLVLALKPPVGGTLYTQGVAGTTTPTGATVKQPQKLMVGTFTPTSITFKQPQKLLAGTTTPVGGLRKLVSKTMVGTITPTGLLTASKVAVRAFAGTITPTGLLVRQPQKRPAGTTTPLGALGKLVAKRATGQTTPTGALSASKVVVLAFAGAFTPTGVLSRRPGKQLVGQSTPSGALVRAVSKMVAGTITPAGALRRFTTKSMSGTITPTGAFARTLVSVRAFAGSTTPTGALLKRTAKNLNGSITMQGSLNKLVAKRMTGTTTPTGSLVRTIAKAFAGTITPSGSLATSLVSIPVVLARYFGRVLR